MFTLLGIPVRVHATFPLILFVLGVEGYVHGGLSEALYAMALVLIVFGCVVLHEMGHSLQARRYGVVVRDIVLLPIGGMARAERIPEDPVREIVIAVSGPAVNVAIAGLTLGLMALLRRPIGTEGGFLSDVLLVNSALAIFNLIPAFPMDGGRILRGLLAIRLPYVLATHRAAAVGFLIAQLFALIGFAHPRLIVLPLIAVVVFAGAIGEERMIRARFAADHVDSPVE
jgi:Zn-dependent protease